MGLTRRRFLEVGSLSLLAGALGRPGLGQASMRGAPLLVVVFLRGGADGLHLVPPVGDGDYARVRGKLALAETLPFVTGFGLHPELAPLAPLVRRGELAVVHAAGSPHPTRSHFEAQDFMEAGAPGITRLRDGWLARALGGVGEDPFASLAVAPQLPLTLRGSGSFACSDVDSFGIPGAGGRAREALAQLYAEGDGDPVAAAGRRALAALAELERRVGTRGGARRLRRPTPSGARIEASVGELLRLERAGLGLEAVFFESGGWDTHMRQGAEEGQMAGWIGDLARGIAQLFAELGERRELRLVVMTEFGRTVRPNGSDGTDHGHGSVMLVAGHGVRGGVHDDWAGLREAALHEGRDLPVRTDWRTVLHEVLVTHLGAPPPANTFPGFTPGSLGLFEARSA
ncbi:MAG: DUF1501 domain-containing protein [Myxococcota bacterium]